MEHLKTIVVGFDFSPQSRTALAAAIRIARLGSARIILTTSLQGHIDKDILDSLQAAARRTICEEFIESEFAVARD